MIPRLPPVFLGAPLAHRALHDTAQGRPENSRAAVQAAIDAGYGIEIDVQQSADAHAVVFHDYDLARLTGRAGAVRDRSAKALGQTPLLHGGEGIPSLAEVLRLVAGRVPVLVEVKDQDGAMGADIGPLERAVANDLSAYPGPVAVMSFNPHSVAEMARLLPAVPRGLVTAAYGENWPLDARTRDHLRDIPDFERTGAAFISHEAADLNRARVQTLKEQGAGVLCWTIRSAQDEDAARKIAQNVTFEGYMPTIPS